LLKWHGKRDSHFDDPEGRREHVGRLWFKEGKVPITYWGRMIKSAPYGTASESQIFKFAPFVGNQHFEA
jgi:hypothetical protein